MTNRIRRRSLVRAGVVVLLIAIFNGPVIFAAGQPQHATQASHQAPRSQK